MIENETAKEVVILPNAVASRTVMETAFSSGGLAEGAVLFHSCRSVQS